MKKSKFSDSQVEKIIRELEQARPKLEQTLKALESAKKVPQSIFDLEITI